MSVSIERIVHIIACMYKCQAEAVVNVSQERCYLFLGSMQNELSVSYDEIMCLEYNGIIEFDGGSNDEDTETRVYILTPEANFRIREILNNNKSLLLGP
jgi:hypothetical protein